MGTDGSLLHYRIQRAADVVTGNLRAVRLLLGHSKSEITVRDLGIEVDDAIEIAENIDI